MWTSCLPLFKGCMPRNSLKAQVSGWPRCSASSSATGERCGRRGRWVRAQLFIFLLIDDPASWEGVHMPNATILLVEDNPDHEALTVRALKKAHLMNEIIVAHDGAEALELLLGTDSRPARPPMRLPQLVLLDLKLPKVDGLEVLRRMREKPRTKLVPVVVLTSSDE